MRTTRNCTRVPASAAGGVPDERGPSLSDRIETVAALEGVVGKTPPPVNLKVIDHLDETALRWIAVSPLAFAGFGDGASIAITLAGGNPGFASGDRAGLRLPLAMLDDPALVEPGRAFSSLFLAPGIGETLRVNGRVAEVRDGDALVTVEECYVHCAKALIRSGFWSATPVEAEANAVADVVAGARFMALATIDAGGRADLSPKGDPAGRMVRLDDGCLWFADRPGNRRTDSFRNIIVQPRVAAALLVPGSHSVAIVRGTARLTTDEAVRARFTVQDKVPRLAIGIEDLAMELRPSPALERARLWPVGERAADINPAGMFAAHVKLNKNKGLAARLAGAVVSIPGFMQKGLDKDYKSNLY
ncbi:pyridoxamine 5-phosphate oxidase [Reyranella sp. CPCC 100927]|nr:pyridoxamine 5-phosphate oxidase [Reyranella sp. CPCC 100927]